MENKNTIIALTLMLVVWVGFTLYSQTKVDKAPLDTEISPPVVAQNQPAENRLVSDFTANLADKKDPATIKPREITIETDNYIAVLSNQGASLKSFKLKKYKVSSKEDSDIIDLVQDKSLPTLQSSGENFFQTKNEDLFYLNTDENYFYINEGDTKELSFQFDNSYGVTFIKKYVFNGDGYEFPVTISAYNKSDKSVDGKISLSLVTPFSRVDESSSLTFVGPATFIDDDVETLKRKAIEQSAEYGNNAVWTAFQDEYFMSAVVPLENSLDRIKVYRDENSILNRVYSPDRTLAPQANVSFDYLVYFGPRDPEILKALNYQLYEIIDFGIFDFIARPLLYVLNFFYSFVGNYGVAIILLTVLIKIIFWPLTQKSYSSMKAMQTLQPEMQKIREKFKNDKERLNREIMELYKNKRVNPLGGCLPMLIQIPVFFALYKVLLGNIALRHAPFTLWITDLSAKDPYYITPIIMGGTMFLQQKMTPTTMDPTQAKIFLAMPIVFTFLFLNFPSGLVIYWLVNNILTILQQYLINRTPLQSK